MTPFHLVVDSSALLDASFAKENEIHIVPLKIIFGEEVYNDGNDLAPAKFYDMFEHAKELPKTSQPTPAEFEEAFRGYSDDLPIICTTISSELSGTYNSAMQACQELPDKTIYVVDTRTAGPAHLKIVQSIASLQKDNVPIDDILAILKVMISNIQFIFTVSTLEYLRRGGRIGSAQAMLGSLLSIKPLLGVEDGHIVPLEKIRTFSKVLDRMVEEVVAANDKYPKMDILVTHSNSEDHAKDIAKRCKGYSQSPIPIMDIGPVLAAHSGPGAIGIVFIPTLAILKQMATSTPSETTATK